MGADFDCDGGLIAFGGNCTSGPIDVATACRAKGGSGHGDFESETFICGPLQSGHTPRGHGMADVNSQAVDAGHLVAFETRFARNGRGAPEEIVPPLKAQSGRTGKGDSAPCVAGLGMAVRRLMPVECEKLQGFPTGYTLIPYRGKPAADGNRYKAIGNSMPVPVMLWIGRRILEADKP